MATFHRTQQQRRAATQAALLDATVEALATYGYAGTTTTAVARIAGVSRGAQVHHFHTKADLVAAAIRHVAVRRAEQLAQELGSLPADARDRIGAALDLLWRSHSGPLFHAGMELWTAARTDDELRDRLAATEAGMAPAIVAYCAPMFGADVRDPAFSAALDTSLAAIRGTALLANLGGDAEAAWAACREHLRTLFPINGPQGAPQP